MKYNVTELINMKTFHSTKHKLK